MHDPQPDFRPVPGMAEPLSPGLRRIVAPNPSPMTFRGTNTYLVGTTKLAVIDPGPDDPAHLDAILAASAGARITHILVTHAHLDHAPLSRDLSRATGAPVYAFGHAEAGRSATMQALAESGLVGGGEGVDHGFDPDELLEDGDTLHGPDWSLRALHTPGHMANHMAFAWDDKLFSGDLVMGWATSLVSPPDGDLTAFMASVRRLQAQDWSVLHPGHGAPVDNPAMRLQELLAHRLGREASILDALGDGPASAEALTHRIYTDTPRPLLAAAERNVLAHLIDLSTRGLVTARGGLSARAVFARL